MSEDRFEDLESLKAHLRRDRDYRIRCLDRRSRYTVTSIHGGWIEPGTSAIAREIAGRNHNLFDFQGLRRDMDKMEMHVTSTKFRDPQLMRLLKHSEVAVSIHGMGTEDDTTIWLGGLNTPLKRLTHAYLLLFGFAVNPDSPRYRGENPNNFVNLAQRHGIQLELPDNLLKTLFATEDWFHSNRRRPKTTERFDQLVTAVRMALVDYRLGRRV